MPRSACARRSTGIPRRARRTCTGTRGSRTRRRGGGEAAQVQERPLWGAPNPPQTPDNRRGRGGGGGERRQDRDPRAEPGRFEGQQEDGGTEGGEAAPARLIRKSTGMSSRLMS